VQLKLCALGEFPAVLAWLSIERLQAKMAPRRGGAKQRGKRMAWIQALRSTVNAKKKKLFSHSVLKCGSSRQLIL